MKTSFENGKAIQEQPPAMGIFFPERVLWQWVADILIPVYDNELPRTISGFPMYLRQALPQYGEEAENDLFSILENEECSGIHFVHLSGMELYIPIEQIDRMGKEGFKQVLTDGDLFPHFEFTFIQGDSKLTLEFFAEGHIVLKNIEPFLGG